MGKVQLLPDQVANQIAAGEVVERPASVVKELVENALDSGATQIEVEIQAGGRNLIRVSDNGCGMERDDALMCLERHATSKLRKASDLVEMASFGFRGEAIPSIASVSLFQLTTACENEDGTFESTQIIVDGGKVVAVKEAGHPKGTTIEVRQLFHNVPARKKFLKSDETERSHIQEYIYLVALSHPEVSIQYIQDHKRIYHLPGIPSGKKTTERIVALKKRWRQFSTSTKDFIEVYHEGALPISHPNEQQGENDDQAQEKAWLVIWGLIGKPGVSRSTRTDQHLFVNERPIQNKVLNTAILEGYHTALPKGRYPMACLFFELDPAEIDINIHPAKKEIKFQKERAIRNVTSEAIREALIEFATQSRLEPELQNEREENKVTPSLPKPDKSVLTREYQPDMIPTELEEVIEQNEKQQLADPAREKTEKENTIEENKTKNSPENAKEDNSKSHEVEKDKSTSPEHQPFISDQEPTLKVPLKIIGMAGSQYIILESDRGVVIMDQKAARARVLYERILQSLEKDSIASQRLLLPETFELNSKDAQALKENVEKFKQLGVEMREFGERTFVLEALPPVIRIRDARQFAIELIDRIRLGGTGSHSWDFGEESLAKQMAYQAISQNPVLSEEEIHLVMRDLRYCRMPYTSPDGRPTLIEMSYSELDRKFGLK